MRSRFGMGIFFVASIFSSLAYADSYDDLGQNRLRERWHEIQNENQTQTFLRVHRMSDIAEDAWSQILRGQNDFLRTPSNDVFVAHYQAQTLMRSHPFDFSGWIQAYIHLFRTMAERPWDGILVIKNIAEQWLVPMGFALILVLIFHLWLWHRVLIADSPRWIRLNSRLTIYIALTTLLMTCWISASLMWGLHLLLCLTIAYSRKNSLPSLMGFVTAVLLSLAPFADVFVETQQMGSLNEALQLGRTRIEFSPSALQNLTPIQRAIWSARNADPQSAQYWLNHAPDGFERSALELEIHSSDLSVSELLSGFEDLAKKFPNEAIVQYNLVQLYTKSQDLVKADRIRQQMNPEVFKDLSQWTRRSNQELVGPQNDPQKSPPLEFFNSRMKSKAAQLGLIPFAWPRGFFYLIGFLMPWFLWMAAFYQRRRASGLCAYTSETSPSPIHLVSAIYQSALQRREPSAQPFRAQVEQAVRAYGLLKSRRARTWNFWLMGSYELIYDDALTLPFLKTLAVYGLIWFALPLSTRYRIADLLKISLEPQFGPMGVFALPLLLAILLWFYFQWERYRKADL